MPNEKDKMWLLKTIHYKMMFQIPNLIGKHNIVKLLLLPELYSKRFATEAVKTFTAIKKT